MNCNQAKYELALWAGNDLTCEAEAALKRHLAGCPQCRELWQSLRTSQDALREAANVGPQTPHSSIWPRLQSQLAARQSVRPSAQPAGWFPVLAVAAACLAVIFLSRGTPSLYLEPEGNSLAQTTLLESGSVPAPFPTAEPSQSLLLPASTVGNQQNVPVYVPHSVLRGGRAPVSREWRSNLPMLRPWEPIPVIPVSERSF